MWVMGWVLGAALLQAWPVAAHDLRPGVLAFREVSPERFALRLTPAQDGSGVPVALKDLELPGACRFEPEGVRCPGGFQGALRLPELSERRVKVLIHVRWLSGRTFEALLREGEVAAVVPAAVNIDEVGSPEASNVRTLWRWLLLGWGHILEGLDHLLFVLGLALVARRVKALFWAVTGFTLAHSVTLAVTAWGWVSPPSEATELVIAASILLLAVEAARSAHLEVEQWGEAPEVGLTARRPWAVALLFGLVHGFGFAGALAELGLPQRHALWALLGFNLGVELGQLCVLSLGLVLGGAVLVGLPQRHHAQARRSAAYVMGCVAAVWVVSRAVAWGHAL